MTEQAAVALTRSLGGRWHGRYGHARCPAHDDREPSLSVAERDGRVLVKCHAGCQQADVIDALRRRGLWLLISEHKWPCPGAEQRHHKAEVPQDRRGIKLARRIWQQTKSTLETPVETYVRSRGITIPIPTTIRYHSSLKHAPTGLQFPAMVAAVESWPGHHVVGVHRTFITADGSAKAPVKQPRMMLGACAGSAVRLSPAAEYLQVGEGIETCLAAMQASEQPTWAALSTSGLRSLILPSEVRHVLILADGDKAGEEAAQQAAHRWLAEGRRVGIARPPQGLDFNDVLLGRVLAKIEDAAA